MTATWPLPKLLTANRNALTVYAALRWLAGDSRRLCTTRARIGDACGLYRDTITAALQALDAAGWVRLRYGRAGTRTWFRLSFPGAGFFPVPAKTRHRKAAATGKNPTQETISCGGKNPLHSRKGVGVPPAARGTPHVEEPEHEFLPDDPGPDAESTVAFLTRMGVLRPEGGRP